jgi:hypothetical protein
MASEQNYHGAVTGDRQDGLTQEKDYGNGTCNSFLGLYTTVYSITVQANCPPSQHTNSTIGYTNGNSNSTHLHEGMGSEDALRRIRTAGSISISPELFEKIYLSPQNNVKGELRKTFGNPTPL